MLGLPRLAPSQASRLCRPHISKTEFISKLRGARVTAMKNHCFSIFVHLQICIRTASARALSDEVGAARPEPGTREQWPKIPGKSECSEIAYPFLPAITCSVLHLLPFLLRHAIDRLDPKARGRPRALPCSAPLTSDTFDTVYSV